MPKLGESVTEGTIEKWLVKPGDIVAKYDSLAEVNTDKVTAEIPSSFSGTIQEIIVQEGETVEVDVVVCTIKVDAAAASSTTESVEPQATEVEHQQSIVEQIPTAAGRYSPAVVRLASEHNIDLNTVAGTGRGGRITRKDVLKIIDGGAQLQPSDEPNNTLTERIVPPTASGDIEIPVSNVRRAIANNMVRSVQEAPHAWTMVEVDVTNLVQFRDSIKEEFKRKEGFNLTYFAFFVKAVSQALKEFPEMNSMWAGDKIVQKKDINISIAVATEDALYVPVIQQTDEKTIKGIARSITDLATKVRTKKLAATDMEGGTFTVNNTGSFGSVQSMGIINYPQAAILQVESIVKRPVVMDNGMIAVRDIVNICLSLDHRVLDGLICGRFLARVKEILENMSAETTSMY